MTIPPSALADLARLGGLQSVTPPSVSQTKAASVEQASLMKQAIYGDSAEQLRIATSVLQDGLDAQSEEIRDLRSLDPIAFAAKYGVEAQLNRHRYAAVERGLREKLDQERTFNRAAEDAALTAASAVTGLAGNTANLAGTALDAVNAYGWRLADSTSELVGGPKISPDHVTSLSGLVTQATDAAMATINADKSELSQERAALLDLANEVSQEDNAILAEQLRQRNANQGFVGRELLPWIQEQGRNIADVGSNYLNDPIMMGDLAVQGVASVLPVAKVIQSAGRASALSQLTRGGAMTREAAEAYLTTAAGRDLLRDSAIRVAPTVTAITEGGAGMNQAQSSIFAMTEAELMESGLYVSLREQGRSHEEAQMQVAQQAGITAAPVAVGGALLAGKIAAPFAANPLSAGGKGVIGAGRNISSEIVEEFAQEANSQFASNTGARYGAGLDVALDDGVAAAGVAGALGGAMTAGGLQAPAALGSAASAIVAGSDALETAGGKLIEARQAQVAASVDDTSTVGAKAQEQAASSFAGAASSVLTALQSTPEQSEALGVVRNQITAAAFLSPEEEAAFSQAYPVLAEIKAKNPEAPIARSQLMKEVGRVLTVKETTPAERNGSALTVLQVLEELRAVDADSVKEGLLGTEAEAAYPALLDELKTLESSPILKRAEEVLNQMNPESLSEIIDLSVFSNPEAAPEDVAYEAANLELISRYAPTAVDPSIYDIALNQARGLGRNENLIRKLEAAKKVAEEFRAADQAKETLEAEQKAAIDAIPEEISRKKAEKVKHGTYDIVRNEIQLKGNSSNSLPSLIEHRRKVADAASAGRMTMAQDSLIELTSFAESQINKMKAYEESLANGLGRPGAVGFEAYGPFGKFAQKPVWVDTSNPASVAMAKEAMIDTKTTVALAQALASTYGLNIPTLTVPDVQFEFTGTTPNQTTPEQSTETQETAVAATPAPETVQPSQAEAVATATAPAPEVIETPVIDDVIEPVVAETTPVQVEATQTTPDQTAPAADVQEVGEITEALAPAIPEPVTDAVTPWFDSLKGKLPVASGTGKNILINAFKPRPGASSLPGYDNPAEAVSQALSSPAPTENAVAGPLKTRAQALSPSVTGAVAGLVSEALPKFSKRFHENMNHLIKRRTIKDLDGKQSSFAELLSRSGSVDKILGFNNTLPLNFITGQDAEGNYEIEPKILQATFMAASDWMADKAGRKQPVRDREDVSKLFGLGRNGRVTKEMSAFARSGIPLQTAIEDIATGMQNLLGLSENIDAPTNETQGLFRSMAANALEVLLEPEDGVKGDLVLNSINYEGKDPVTGEKTPLTMMSVSLTEEARNSSMMKALSRAGSPFAKLFLAEPEEQRFVGVKPNGVTPNQIRNKLAGISDKARRVIQKLQDAPSYVNLPMADLWSALGDDALKAMLGYVPITEELKRRTNKNDLERIKGKNQSIDNAFEQVRIYMEEAAAQGNMGEVPIYFAWMLSSVGRLQQQGPITPQGDKFARELMSATNSVLDLRKPEHVQALWLGIAQSLGVKIEQRPFEDSISEARDLIDNGLAPAVEQLQAWLEGGILDNEAFQEALAGAKDAKGKPLAATPKLIHAVLTAARAGLAYKEGSEDAFTTALALEADGKTDGPINAMMHLMTGRFTEEEIERLAKGGFFFSSQPVSLNDFIQAEHTRSGGQRTFAEDLYHLAAARLKSMMGTNPDQLVQNLTVLRVLDALLPDFTLAGSAETGFEVEIGRNLVKNPLTVFLYGSGEKGIGDKLANAMLKTLYSTLSEIAAGKIDGTLEKGWMSHPLFVKNPNLIHDLTAILGKKDIREMADFLANPVEAEVSAVEFKQLSENVLESFAQPMLEAVNEVTGGLVTNMRALQGMSQVQTAIFQGLYEQAREAQIRESGEKYPSRAEVEEAFISVMGFAPIYETEDQSFHISKPEKQTTSHVVSTSFGGQLASKLTGLRPADASVKISPYMTIGSGDGQMLLNAMDQTDVPMEKSLLVFDGVEMALDQITEMSGVINKGVYDGWMGSNVYEAALKGFRQMLTRLTPEMYEALPDSVKLEVGRAMGYEKGVMAGFGDLKAVEALMEKLAADQTARKEAIKGMASQTDHMAGAQAPHSHEGKATVADDPLAYREIAATLNRAKRKAERVTPDQSTPKEGGYAQPADPELVKMLQKVGQGVPGQDAVTMVSGKAVVKAARNFFDADQTRVFHEVVKADPSLEEATFYFGSSEELELVRDSLGLAPEPIELGLTYLGANVAFIANTSPETILHEMIHIATGRVLVDHYSDSSVIPAHVGIAVRHLEGLMAEVRSFNALNPALAVLKHTLDKLEGRPAEQMMEFLSYTLSNQDLIETAKTQNSYQRLGRIVKAGLKLLKQLLGLRNSDMPRKDIFSQVRFNARILGMSPALEGAKAEEQNQITGPILSQIEGNLLARNDRLNVIKQRFTDKLKQLVQADKVAKGKDQVAKAESDRDLSKLLSAAKAASVRATAGGFRMNTAERQAFRSVYAALQSAMTFDPSLLRQVHKLHDHVLANLGTEHLIEAGAADLQEARAMLTLLTDDSTKDMLPMFMALSQVNPVLRTALEAMPGPKRTELDFSSTDNAVDSIGEVAMSTLTRLSLEKPGKIVAVSKELDRLGHLLSAAETENRLSQGINALSGRLDEANAWTGRKIEAGANAAEARLSQREKAAKTKAGKISYGVLASVVALGSKDASAKRGEALTSFMNRVEGWDAARAMLLDFRGATGSTLPILRLVNVVKAKLDGIRQDFREGTPKVLREKFKKNPKNKDWSAMHQVLGATDIMALGHTEAEALLRDPGSLDTRIAAAEETISGLNRTFADAYKVKAKALAIYMARKEVTSKNLLKNARSISYLHNEKVRPDPLSVTEALQDAIERLVALYAYREQDATQRAAVEALAVNEPEGIEAVLGVLGSARLLERSKTLPADAMASGVALNNALQGYIPALNDPNTKIIIEEDSKHSELKMRGWERIGTYHGDPREDHKTRRSYYQSNTAGKATFRQGIAQTVHATFGGANLRTGQLLDGVADESLLGNRAKRIALQIQNGSAGQVDGLKPGEYLIPILDGEGQVVGYDRPLLVEKTRGLQKDTHMGRMLGVWMGRMFEEGAAHEFNRTLIETAKATYEADFDKGRGAEYVNVAKSEDPVIKDAWRTMGQKIKEDAAEAFGRSDFFPVRKELVNDVLGYRSASVTDFFTGQTRWNEDVQKAVKSTAEFMLGAKAYPWLKKAEGGLQTTVSFARTNYIVRSVIVAVDNIQSNILHLGLRGVPLLSLPGALRRKWVETSEYVKNLEKIQALKIELAAKARDRAESRRLEARLEALRAANAKLSIAPVIAAGEFSTISEDLTEADVAIREGRWSDYVERLASRLPAGLSTAARYALITKDTALFKALNRMVQYGDFVAKAVLYEHYMNQGMDQRQALDEIMEEFVQYNRLPGRDRGALEDAGLLWFWNYKLRIMKVMAKTARDRPLSALAMMSGVGPSMDIDTVFSGSLAGNYLDGSLGYSVGPEMGINGVTMNPWVNLMK